MKIVILTDGFLPALGGAERVASQLAFGYVKSGHQVDVITTHLKDKLIQENYKGVSVWLIPTKQYHQRWQAYRSLYNPSVVRGVKEVLQEIKPDIVHVHNIHYQISYYSLKYAKRFALKVFLTAHDVMLFHYAKLLEFIDPTDLTCPDEFSYKVSIWQQLKRFKKRYNPLRNIIIKHYLKYVDRIIAVSKALQQALCDNKISNTEVIYNGISVNNWQVDCSLINDFQQKYNLNKKKVILYIGRIFPLKGTGQLLEAFADVLAMEPGAALLIVGEHISEEGDYLDKQSFKSLSDKIISTGRLSGDLLTAAYHASDVVVVPSITFDSFPTVNFEAMACKKPVIATCFGGSRELVLDGETGYIINPYNTKKFTDRICELLANPERARLFGQRGYERVKEKFSLDKQINSYLELFQQSLSDIRSK